MFVEQRAIEAEQPVITRFNRGFLIEIENNLKIVAAPFFDLQHTVLPDEIDAQQHVHNLRYLQWTLWAARDASAAGGWDAAEALRQGTGWVVRGHDITYRAAALSGDHVIVRTWVSEVNRYASKRNYVICRPRDRTVLARVQTRWVFVDLVRHRAIEIPPTAVSAIHVLEKNPPMPWEQPFPSSSVESCQ